MCSSYPAHKNTYLSANSCPIPTQLGTHHLPMYGNPLALLSALPKCSRNQNMDIHEHPLPGPISQKRVRRFSPFFAHRSFTIIPTGVPICSPKFRAHVSSNSLFHGSRSRMKTDSGVPYPLLAWCPARRGVARVGSGTGAPWKREGMPSGVTVNGHSTAPGAGCPR